MTIATVVESFSVRILLAGVFVDSLMSPSIVFLVKLNLGILVPWSMHASCTLLMIYRFVFSCSIACLQSSNYCHLFHGKLYMEVATIYRTLKNC
jgi:hypothetical protein